MTNKFKAGDKVKRISGSFAGTYVGGEYTVVGYDVYGEDLKLEGMTAQGYDDSCFELIEPVLQLEQQFDIHKDKWFIRTPTKEVSKFVQEWLFEQGLKWQSLTKDDKIQNYCDGYVVALSVFEKDSFMWCFAAPEGYQEIKLTFKTVVDTVEYPIVLAETLVTQEQSEAQKQVDILEQKIKELQDQLEVVKEEIK